MILLHLCWKVNAIHRNWSHERPTNKVRTLWWLCWGTQSALALCSGCTSWSPLWPRQWETDLGSLVDRWIDLSPSYSASLKEEIEMRPSSTGESAGEDLLSLLAKRHQTMSLGWIKSNPEDPNTSSGMYPHCAVILNKQKLTYKMFKLLFNWYYLWSANTILPFGKCLVRYWFFIASRVDISEMRRCGKTLMSPAKR